MATGRRKEAVARVRLVAGSGQQTVNGRPMRDYQQREVLLRTVLQPLESAQTATTFDIIANVHGGGVTGQAGALRLGLARALLIYDAELRKTRARPGC
jgi:small subunit ribosomal protein S9